MEISEKVAYLKGLAEGLALDTDTKEGKLLTAIIDVLDDMAEKFVDLEDELCDVEDGLSSTRIPWRAARSAAPTAARSWSSISATWPMPRTMTRTRNKQKPFKTACCLRAARCFVLDLLTISCGDIIMEAYNIAARY